MTTKHPIDTVIDDQDQPYAYCYATKDGDYGHMNVRIRLGKQKFAYNRPEGSILVSCQIGSGFSGSISHDEQCEAPYCWRVGFDTDMGHGSLRDLEIAVKYLRKIDKHLAKVRTELGYPVKYADYCQCILQALGVKVLIAERQGWAIGGAMRDKLMFRVGEASLDALHDIERIMIGAFSRKAA